MTVDQPKICRDARLRSVVSEIVVGHAHGAVCRYRDGWQERLLIARRDVGRSLVNGDRQGPCRSSVGGGRQSDPGILPITETQIFPDRVKLAVVAVHCRGKYSGEVSRIGNEVTGFRVRHKKSGKAGDAYWPRPRDSSIVGADNSEQRILSGAPIGELRLVE